MQRQQSEEKVALLLIDRKRGTSETALGRYSGKPEGEEEKSGQSVGWTFYSISGICVGEVKGSIRFWEKS